MTAGDITKLDFSVSTALLSEDTVLQALSRCILAYPRAVEHLKLELRFDGLPIMGVPSRLQCLPELHIDELSLDIATIASLPWPQQFEIGPDASVSMLFASYLEDTKTFVPLKVIGLHWAFSNAF